MTTFGHIELLSAAKNLCCSLVPATASPSPSRAWAAARRRTPSISTTSPPTSTSLPTLPLPRLLLSPSPCLHSSNSSNSSSSSSSSSKLCSSSNSLRAFTRNRYRSQLDPTFPQAHNMSHPSLRPLHLPSIRYSSLILGLKILCTSQNHSLQFAD